MDNIDIKILLEHNKKLNEIVDDQSKQIRYYIGIINESLYRKEFEKEIEDHNDNSFKYISDLMIKYLNDYHHPHTRVIVTTTSAELFEGVKVNTTYEFLKD